MVLYECRRFLVDTVYFIYSIIMQIIWTAVYLFYFLFKGKPEWKCERMTDTSKNCCVETKTTKLSSTISSQLTDTLRTGQPRVYRGKTLTQKLTETLHNSSTNVKAYGRRISRICRTVIVKILEILYMIILYLLAFLKALVYTNVPSKTLPSTPKPFPVSSTIDNTSFNKVEFNPEDHVANATNDVEVVDYLNSNTQRAEEQHQLEQSIPIPSERQHIYDEDVDVQRIIPNPIPHESYVRNNPLYPDNQSYINQLENPRFTDTSLDSSRNIKRIPAVSQSLPLLNSQPSPFPTPPSPLPPLPTPTLTVTLTAIPPPPPLASFLFSPPLEIKPIRIHTVVHNRMDIEQNDRDAYHQNHDATSKKKDPPGIGKLPADVMAELHGTQKMRQEREASTQREMTQSCHPDMAQWKTIENDSRYDRSASATPFRASSVGPTMRRLEQVVSRLDDTSDNESQYVFRAKPTSYTLGNQVFSSIDATEKMRDSINRIPTYESSRPITPAHSVVSGCVTPLGYEIYAPSSYKSEESGVRRRARTVDPSSRENMPYSTSSFYATSPVTSHTVRRTPATSDRSANFAYDRGGVVQGSVKGFVNQWPPASNATGANVMKDDWVREILKDNEDELVTTMCRRIVERKIEDKWRWLDEHGRVLDEKNQKTWKLDTVLRDGPGEAKHWSRTVECLPTGDTRFQDVSRQYGSNYVVESIVRNY